MSLKKLLFSSKGKINRLEFVVGYIVLIFGFWVLLFIGTFLDALIYQKETFEMFEFSEPMSIIFALYALTLMLLVIFVTFCLGVKRARDIGISTWFVIAFFIPYLNFITLLFFAIYPGKKTYIF